VTLLVPMPAQTLQGPHPDRIIPGRSPKGNAVFASFGGRACTLTGHTSKPIVVEYMGDNHLRVGIDAFDKGGASDVEFFASGKRVDVAVQRRVFGVEGGFASGAVGKWSGFGPVASTQVIMGSQDGVDDGGRTSRSREGSKVGVHYGGSR
jgi:hypothetical protein